MTFDERFQAKIDQLDRLYNSNQLGRNLSARRREHQYLALRRFIETAKLFCRKPQLLKLNQRSSWDELYADLLAAARDKDLKDLVNSMEEDVASVGRALRLEDQSVSAFSEDRAETSIAKLEDHLTGSDMTTRPSDCFEADDYDFTSRDVFGRMVRLARLEDACRKAGEPQPAPTIYREKFTRMAAALRDASDEDQMNFAILLEQYRVALTDQLASSASPLTEPSFRTLESLSILEESLGTHAKDFQQRLRSSEAYVGRPSVTALHDAFARADAGNFTAAEKQQRADADRTVLEESSYRDMPENIRALSELYSEMMRDTHRASAYYSGMRTALGSFLALRHTNIQDREKYDALLSLAQQTAELYCRQHRGAAPSSVSGIRSQKAQQCLTIFQSLQQAPPEQDLPEDLQRLGRAHHFTGARFIPKTRNTNLEQSRASRFGNGILHGLTTGVRVIASVIGFIPLGIQKLWYRNSEVLQDQKDFERIPGLDTREQFAKFDPERFPSNQKILSDSRRTPLSWERPVPGDPNQPPTVTIHADQSVEGSARANGHGGPNVGHAFLTLEYTRKNPLTGQPQRYKVSFGFYPQGLGSDGLQGVNSFSVTDGVSNPRRPGMLVNDATSHSHASITYPVNNRQINRILLAAQTYPKEGYNLITRNCADFVKEMADLAELDTRGLFQKADFDAGFTLSAGISVALPLSDFFQMRANSVLRENQQRMSLNTTLMGQALVTGDDLQRYKAEDFNLRIRGYIPSRLAEAIKASGKSVPAGNAYVPSKGIPDDAGIKEFYEQELLRESGTLLTAAAQFCAKRHLPEAESQRIGNELRQLLYNYGGISEMLKKGFEAKPKNVTYGGHYHNCRENLSNAHRDILRLRTDIDRYYKDMLHEDPELYIPFQHMTSFFSRMALETERRYANLDTNLTSDFEAGKTYESLAQEMDPEREDAQNIYNFRFGIVKDWRKQSHTTVAASALVYGDSGSWAEDWQRINELDKAEKTRNLTTAEKEERRLRENRTTLVGDLQHGLEYYVTAPRFTPGEIGFLFGKLQSYAERRNVREAAWTFQGLAWNHVLAPSRNRMKDAIQASLRVNEKVLRDENATDKQLEGALSGIGDASVKIIAESLAAPQAGHDSELKQIIESVIQRRERMEPCRGFSGENLTQFENTALTKAAEDLTDSLLSSRFRKQIMDHFRAGLKAMEINDLDLDGEFGDTFENCLRKKLLLGMKAAIAHAHPSYASEIAGQNLSRETQEIANLLAPMADSLVTAPRFSTAMAPLAPVLDHWSAQLNNLQGLHEMTPQQQNTSRGLQKMTAGFQEAAKALADGATLGCQSMTRPEQKEFMVRIAKVAFVPLMNKLDNPTQLRILEKMGRDPNAYDRYIRRIIEKKGVESLIVQGKDVLRPNDFKKYECFNTLLQRCATVFNRQFYKDTHIDNARLPEQNRGPVPGLNH